MALTLEFADSQADRAPQPQPAADPRRPWQSRENRGTTVTSSKHPLTRSTPGTGPSHGSSGRAPEQQRLPLIRVSQAEKAERSRLGLCWHCPEKWVMGHVCKQRLLCYADEDDVFEENMDDDNLAEDVPNNTTAVSINTAIGGGEHSDNFGSVLSIDSSFETELDAFDHDASGEFRPSSIALLCDNRGVEEDRDASLDTRQVPSFTEIYPLCGSDAFLPLIERDFTVLFQENVHDRLEILKLRKMMNSSLLKEDRNGFYVDLHSSTVASMNFRSSLPDGDARFIPPQMDTRCLSIRARIDKILVSALNYHEPALVIFYGDNEGRYSIARCAFDPGGDILVGEHKVVFEMKKQKLEVGEQEMRQLYADELRVQTGGLVVKESPIGNTMEILTTRAQPCVFVPSQCKDLLVQIKQLLGYKNNNFGVFDPGGGASPKLWLSTVVVASWFPP